MARSLGIDYGEARIGLALSDPLGLLARPWEVLQVAEGDVLARIGAVVREHGVRVVVVGLPLRMDGSEGTATRRVRAFVRELAPFLPEGTEVVEQDERLSTVTAEERQSAAGRKVPPRAPVDHLAAAVILQDYLDQRNGPAWLPDPWGEDAEDEPGDG
jgi:putative Holliday junction resolvase